MLTQVLEVRSLLDQAIDLHLEVQLLAGPKVFARELLLDARQDLQRPCVLYFLGFRLVRGRDAGAMPVAHQRAHLGDVAHDRLAALGWVVGFRRRVATVAETPGKEGVVDELVDVSRVR
jgi:hypothetical protein